MVENRLDGKYTNTFSILWSIVFYYQMNNYYHHIQLF